MDAGSVFVFIKGHVFCSSLDLSILNVMMCVVAFVCLSYKYFCMSKGGWDGYSGAFSLRSHLSPCMMVLLLLFGWETSWFVFSVFWVLVLLGYYLVGQVSCVGHFLAVPGTFLLWSGPKSSWYRYQNQIPSGPFIPVPTRLVPVPWSNIWSTHQATRILISPFLPFVVCFHWFD